MTKPSQETPDVQAFSDYLENWQEQLYAAIRRLDETAGCHEDNWQHKAGGGGRSLAFSEGRIFEKGGINYSHIHGERLAPASTSKRPELAGRPFQAMGVSIVFHPLNPYVPTVHCNLRFFATAGEKPVWWFGGGYDLTPYYPFHEDVVAWHRAAREACLPFGKTVYPRCKKSCDDYFFLPHRNETRGVGGLFFDDLNQWGWTRSFAFARSIGNSFFPAYEAIVKRRQPTKYGRRERDFQAYRRARYVEFNLVYDRGTLFGLQSKGRTESVLTSMPPNARWVYGWTPDKDSKENDLYSNYLQARDWLKEP